MIKRRKKRFMLSRRFYYHHFSFLTVIFSLNFAQWLVGRVRVQR